MVPLAPKGQRGPLDRTAPMVPLAPKGQRGPLGRTEKPAHRAHRDRKAQKAHRDHRGPGGPIGPQGEPLVWADVLEEHRVEEATYVLGVSYTSPRDGGQVFPELL